MDRRHCHHRSSAWISPSYNRHVLRALAGVLGVLVVALLAALMLLQMPAAALGSG